MIMLRIVESGRIKASLSVSSGRPRTGRGLRYIMRSGAEVSSTSYWVLQSLLILQRIEVILIHKTFFPKFLFDQLVAFLNVIGSHRLHDMRRDEDHDFGQIL